MWILFLLIISWRFAEDLNSYRRSLAEHPIETSISLRPVDEVPFPAVIIDVGDSIDPLGLVRESQNMVDESNIPRQSKENPLHIF